MMRLTWKDGVATTFAAATVGVYAAFLHGTDWPIINGVRGVTATILVFGAVGGCSMSRADLYSAPRTTAKRVFAWIAGTAGVVALVAAVSALISADQRALAVFFSATLALWVIATVRHAFTPDVHEADGPAAFPPHSPPAAPL